MDSDSGSLVDYDGSSLVARWTGEGIPDYAQCRETALAQGGQEVGEVRTGTVLCVKTARGRIARLEVVEVKKFESFRTNTTVWEAG